MSRITIKETAEMLNISQQTLRVALQQNAFPEFGKAIKTSSKYTYYINKERLIKYLNAA